jgi:hypothetical protein
MQTHSKDIQWPYSQDAGDFHWQLLHWMYTHSQDEGQLGDGNWTVVGRIQIESRAGVAHWMDQQTKPGHHDKKSEDDPESVVDEKHLWLYQKPVNFNYKGQVTYHKVAFSQVQSVHSFLLEI